MKYDVKELLNSALMFKDVKHDLDLALKYASMASVCTFSPRADVCCTIGEIYLEKGNCEWAKFWYEKALNNMSCGLDEETVDTEYWTTIPMLKLGFISHVMNNDEGALEYFEAVLKIDPTNEIAKNNIEQLNISQKTEETPE